jgi:hypothetical protein
VTQRLGSVQSSDEVLHYVERHPDIALWAHTPLLSGGYTRADKPLPEEYDDPGTTRRLAVLDEIAAETGTNRNQVVLAWLTGGNPAATPIVGVSTGEQLDEAVAAVSLELAAGQPRTPGLRDVTYQDTLTGVPARQPESACDVSRPSALPAAHPPTPQPAPGRKPGPASRRHPQQHRTRRATHTCTVHGHPQIPSTTL